MERKEAIEVIKKNWPDSSFTRLREALETLIPELRESGDERIRKHLIGVVELYYGNTDEQEKKDCLAWLEKQGEKGTKRNNGEIPNSAWSDEDEINLEKAIWYVENPAPMVVKDSMLVDWLKSIRPQNRWKPSDEMLEALYRVVPENVMEKSENEILLDKLYQGLKYGRVLSKK